MENSINRRSTISWDVRLPVRSHTILGGAPFRLLNTLVLPRSIIEAGKDVVPRQFGEMINNIVEGHPFRQPAQHIVHRYARISDARLPKTLRRIDCYNFHNDKFFSDAAKIVKHSYPRNAYVSFFSDIKPSGGGNFFKTNYFIKLIINN